MLLISRANSGTAVNLRRHGKCALNYVTFDRDDLQGISNMGLPGMSLEDKEAANPYTMIKSPTPENSADPEFPLIIKEAYQVMECTWDDSFNFHKTRDGAGDLYDSHFILTIDNLYMQSKYVPGIPKGSIFPDMPIFMGFRADRSFWFAEHGAPFSIPLPQVKGLEWQAVNYMANRIDPKVKFTREACEALSGIPTPFMKDALEGIVQRALDDGVGEVSPDYLAKINPQSS
jgi:flavin reductase (DIM6/NTAB) family NADH-FMN oxidoreductase RutF